MTLDKIIKNIFKNTAWLVFAEVISKGLLFFLTILIARYLKADGYGKFSFALSLVTMFSVFIDFGLNILTIREVSKDKNKAQKYINNIISIRVILSIITFGLLFIVLQFLNKETEINHLVYLLVLYIAILKLNELFQGIFRAYEKMKLEAVAKIIQGIVLFGLTVFIISQKYSVIYFAWAYIIASFVSLFFNISLIRLKYVKFRIEINIEFWKKILYEAWPFAMSFAFIGIYYHLDSVILSLIKTDQEVGWYNAAYKPIIFLIAIRGLFGGAIYPSLSKYYPKEINKIKKIISTTQNLAIIIGSALVVGGIILGPKIILLLFGEEYINGALAFQILVIGVGIVYFNLLFPSFLNAIGKQKLYMWVIMFGAITNIVFNILLIPKYSLVGAAIATVLAELIVFILAYYFTNKVIRVKIGKLFIKPIIACIAMGVIIILLYNYLHVLLLILVGFIFYIFIIHLLKGFNNIKLKI